MGSNRNDTLYCYQNFGVRPSLFTIILFHSVDQTPFMTSFFEISINDRRASFTDSSSLKTLARSGSRWMRLVAALNLAAYFPLTPPDMSKNYIQGGDHSFGVLSFLSPFNSKWSKFKLTPRQTRLPNNRLQCTYPDLVVIWDRNGNRAMG